MTIDVVLARMRAVIEASPFALVEAKDPFDFDLQPSTRLDGVYRVEAQMEGREGYMGPFALERWQVSVWLARRAKGAPTAAYALLVADVSALSVALIRAGDADGGFDVSTEDQGADLPAPSAEQDYLVARLRAGVEFDRAL